MLRSDASHTAYFPRLSLPKNYAAPAVSPEFMKNKHYTRTADPVYVPTEPGFLVDSLCGRQWFVPLEEVGRDYANFLAEADGLTPAAAKAKAELDREHWPSWFTALCDEWCDIEGMGWLVRRSTLFKTKSALDRLRGRSIEGCTAVGISALL